MPASQSPVLPENRSGEARTLPFVSRKSRIGLIKTACGINPARPVTHKISSQALDRLRDSLTIASMRTVIETPDFQKQAAKIWREDERLEFIGWLAANSESGDVVPGSGGARKVRWARPGSGKSGGVRVIYFDLTEDQVVLLIAIYAKSARSTMTGHEITRRRKCD